MGVGQPLSRKLKNVHLPQPHPNGGFLDPSLGGGVVLSLRIAALVVGLSEVSTQAVAAAIVCTPISTEFPSQYNSKSTLK